VADRQPAPIYVAARRVLLDALEALQPQLEAVIVVGAQAVYLRTGETRMAVAPYTTDGDLALDPALVGDEPRLEGIMRDAGFALSGGQPGAWAKTVEIDGTLVDIPVDLMVPEALAPERGRRSARIPPHDKMATRRAVGLEAAVIDNDVMSVTALDGSDLRAFDVRVAGSTALLIAKLHKLAERIAEGRADRIADKDAADVYRLMLATPTDLVVGRLRGLLMHGTAGPVATRALELLGDLFGARARPGVLLAVDSMRAVVPAERVEGVCDAFVGAVMAGLEGA
jgi:hypothetical protein